MKDNLKTVDPEIFEIIEKEENRQENNIELIASENFVSNAVLEAQGSVLTNKYAEGYPGHRYYGGCEFIDMAENLAIERVKKLFGAKFANVQPHSGSQANAAAYQALIKPGDTVLGMDLSAGGHLTHGSKVNFSGKNYHFVSYGVDQKTERIDYEAVREIALKEKPRLIVAGASAYSRCIDFKKFREIADEIDAFLMVDMAHIAGLVATNLHPSPIPYAHVVTSTTHKTLRGPRGGLILTNDEAIAKKINSAIFPGTQGGPLEHIIAAKAVAFKEDLEPAFKVYSEQILKNIKAMEHVFQKAPEARLVAGGSDNHLLLIDVTGFDLTGKEAEEVLDQVGITVNKNAIPFETKKPTVTSGIRVGTAAITTRGFKEKEANQVAEIIINALRHSRDLDILKKMKEDVLKLTNQYPLPYKKNN